MTLQELGREYEESAELLRVRLRQLRRSLKESDSPEERANLRRRIAELQPLLTDCNKIAKFCKCYYEKGFYINSGAFGQRERDRPCRVGEVKQLSAQGTALHFDKRTDTKPAGGGGRVSVKGEDIYKFSGRTRRKQVDCFKELL